MVLGRESTLPVVTIFLAPWSEIGIASSSITSLIGCDITTSAVIGMEVTASAVMGREGLDTSRSGSMDEKYYSGWAFLICCLRPANEENDRPQEHSLAAGSDCVATALEHNDFLCLHST